MSESFTREELKALLAAKVADEFDRGPFTGSDLELHERLVAKLQAAIQSAPVATLPDGLRLKITSKEEAKLLKREMEAIIRGREPHTDHTQDGPEAQ